MKETIGFIGLGQLGLPMATNLLEAGYSLKVYNRTPGKAQPLVARGAQLASRPADAVPRGGIVVTIVWDDVAVESLVRSDGFLEQLGADGIHVSMSTLQPQTSKKLAALHAQHGSHYIEAPVFGRPEAAVSQKLWIPFVGPQLPKERVRPLLEAVGAQGIFDFGEEVGAANIVKLVGNFLIFSAALSLKEALSLAEKNGVAPKAVVEMLTQSLFPAPIYQTYGKLLTEKIAPFSQLEIPLKDVALLKNIARHLETPTPIANLVDELLLRSNEAA